MQEMELHPQRVVRSLENKGKGSVGMMFRIGTPPEPFDDFARDMAIRLGLTGGPIEVETAEKLSNMIKSMYHIGMWLRAGRKVFRLSEGLAQRLDLTDLKRLPCELFRLPFPAVYVKLPRMDNPVTLTDTTSNTLYEADGAYLVQVEDDRIDVMIAALNPNNLLDDQITYLTLKMTGHKDVYDAFVDCFSGERWSVDDEAGQKATIATFTRAWGLIANTILYLSSSDPELSPRPLGRGSQAVVDLEAIPPKKIKSQKKHDEELARQRRISWKEPIVIDVGLSFKKEPEWNGLGHGQGPTCRFPVRGHWRKQLVGTGRTVYKPTWVRPYMKGPELAEVISEGREYVLRDGKES